MTKGLYPSIDCYDFGHLQVDDLHSIYYEQSGNPNGVPVLFFHGGPGAGSSPMHRRFFDPQHYRIVIFDQRGCGKSKPHAEIRQNTTPLLIADAEALRVKLGIEKWHVFGGSWGSTLSLAYAIAHPTRVHSLTLRGIFLLTPTEIDWFLYGINTVFPEEWQKFVSVLPEDERGDLLGNFFKRLTHPDPAVHMPAAQSWAAYETACCLLNPDPKMTEDSKEPSFALPISRIEAHYFVNNKFTPENALIENIDKIRHIPAVIIQGRYDMVCPIVAADALHRAWPEARYVIVTHAGHNAFDPELTVELVNSTNSFRTIK